jgi:hypothetical protein
VNSKPIAGGFWAVQMIAFSPRVKPLGKYRCPFFGALMVRCRVTGRDSAHRYHGYRPGDMFDTNASNLYRNRRVIRGTFGRLMYQDRITADELAALPEVAP